MPLKRWQFGNPIATLTDNEVNLIHSLDHCDSPVHIQHCILPQIGEQVEIARGSLTGYRGYVVAVLGKTKVRLALSSLGCFAEVEVEVMPKTLNTLMYPLETPKTAWLRRPKVAKLFGAWQLFEIIRLIKRHTATQI